METNEIIEKLEELEKTFEEKKASLSRDEGKLESIQERMNAEFGIKTLRKAEKELIKLDEEIEKAEKELHSKYTTMKEAMEKINVQS